jgi:Protein of unknown function (DUF2892)
MPPVNEGTLDRDIRIVLGIVFVILAIFYLPPAFAIVSGALAIVMFVTSATGFCPLYAVLKVNTADQR